MHQHTILDNIVFGPLLFQHDIAQSQIHVFWVWNGRTGLHGAPTPTPLGWTGTQRPYHPTSVPGLTNALADEWEQTPAARIQNLEESLKPEERRLPDEMLNVYISLIGVYSLGVHILLSRWYILSVIGKEMTFAQVSYKNRLPASSWRTQIQKKTQWQIQKEKLCRNSKTRKGKYIHTDLLHCKKIWT